MKPVLIQNLMKKRGRKEALPDPEPSEMQREKDRLAAFILWVLAFIVVGTIAIAA